MLTNTLAKEVQVHHLLLDGRQPVRQPGRPLPTTLMYFQVHRLSPGRRTESSADPGKGVEVLQQRAGEGWLEREQDIV